MREMAVRFGALAAGLVVVLHGAGAHAQYGDDATRAMLYFAVGGGGDTEVEADPSSVLFDGSVDNDATVGVGGRLEVPVAEYAALGFMAEMLSYKAQNVDRDVSGHFDLWAKARVMLDLGIDADLELYLGVPVGFSVVAFDRTNGLKREKRSLGWNIGALLGGQLFFTERWGAMLELGWRRVQVYNHQQTFDLDLTTRTNQFAMNVGGVMVF